MARSIMHNKEDGTCYLCMLLRDDFDTRSGLQEHHAMPGTANRKLSERYGLKVYLCLEHHTAGPEAVHNNIRLQRLLQKNAQMAFERKHSHEEWMEAFGRSFI
jgi:hypothetical protein